MPQQKLATIRDVGIKETAKGQLFQVTTTDGTEYSTFNGAYANQARQLVGQNVLLSFTEKQVVKNGQTYVNRYYDGAEPSGQTFGNPGGQTQWAGPNDVPQLTIPQVIEAPAGDRELKIMRQTATKVAALMLPHMEDPKERTPAGLLVIAEFLLAYYQHGFSNPSNPASFHAEQPVDDDIPFLPTIDGLGN
jgi:hypothetical protein